MKQTIEEAAMELAYDIWKEKGGIFYDRIENEIPVIALAFQKGAYSEAAKDFHTQGMYSEEDIIKMMDSFYMDWATSESEEAIDFNLWFEEYKKRKK